MTSKIIVATVAIVAIAAAVLSLAAPVAVEAQPTDIAIVAVDAQTPDIATAAVDAQKPYIAMQVNKLGLVTYRVGGLSDGTYYFGNCISETAFPASCPYNSKGVLPVQPGYKYEPWGCITPGTTVPLPAPNTGRDLLVVLRHGPMPGNILLRGRYRRAAVYSDANCQTEVVAMTYTYQPDIPSFNVRNITRHSATIYPEGDYWGHLVDAWRYTLTPGSGDCRLAGYSIAVLRDLSPGTTYTHRIYPTSAPFRGVADSEICVDRELRASVTFTTAGSRGDPPGEVDDPPGEVDDPPGEADGETTTEVNGNNVTISWANPGDPDIAIYEYLLRRDGVRVGDWTTIPGSNADTTSVTIDLATGAVAAVNNATPPMVVWTIDLRARHTNGTAGRIFTTTVNVTPAGPGTVVPALPLAGLVTLALVLFLGGQRQRKRGG